MCDTRSMANNSNNTRGFDFILMNGNQWNCTTWPGTGCVAWVYEFRTVRGGSGFGKSERRRLTLVHRSTRGDDAAAELLESNLIKRAEAGPAKGHTVLTTEHWDIYEAGRWETTPF